MQRITGLDFGTMTKGFRTINRKVRPSVRRVSSLLRVRNDFLDAVRVVRDRVQKAF